MTLFAGAPALRQWSCTPGSTGWPPASFDDPPGTHETCETCYWEDDAAQLRWPSLADRANAMSLIDAQRSSRQPFVQASKLQ